MCFVYKIIRSSIRNNLFLIFGLFLGVALSVFMSQIVENRCIFHSEPILLKPEAKAFLATDEYEPRINLAGKPLKAQKTPQEFVRPRYYTTELGIRDKLFTAILTSPKTLETFAVPLNNTLLSVQEKTVFFMEAEPNNGRSDVKWNSVVQFSDSRLILKPFHMIKYIADNYIDDYDFFLISRDTTYLRSQPLSELVNSISVSQNVHLGGGKMDDLTSYCSIDAGILLSNMVLQKVVQNLDWCVKNAFSDSDDANLGRCIVHSSSIACSDSIQAVKYSTFKLEEMAQELEFDKLEKVPAFPTAISVWPVPSSEIFYKLHLYFAKLDFARVKLDIAAARHTVLNISVTANNRSVNHSWPVGNSPGSTPSNRFDLLRWDYFTETQIFLKSDFSNVEDLSGADLIDIRTVLNSSILHMEDKYEGQLRFKRFLNGYRRFDPSRGMDYILDLAFQDTTTGKEAHRRIQVCKPLGKVELVPVPYVTENTRVNLILIVTDVNKKEVLGFLDNYVTVCMEKRDKTHLMLVLAYEPNRPGKGTKDDIFSDLKKRSVKHSDRFKRDGSKIAWLSVKLPEEKAIVHRRGSEDFTVGLSQGVLTLALLDLAVRKFAPDNLILVCTSNMDLRQDYLNRVRMNTVKEWQVFSPIPFAEFMPEVVYSEDLPRPKELDINKNYGHYDEMNTDHISFYVKDYKSVRKHVETILPFIHTDKDLSDLWKHLLRQMEKFGWRGDATSRTEQLTEFIGNLSDLALTSVYGMFVRHGGLSVLRATEPGLRLRHREPDCRKVSLQDDIFRPLLYQQCIEKRSFNAGTRSQLGRLILDNLNVNEDKVDKV